MVFPPMVHALDDMALEKIEPVEDLLDEAKEEATRNDGRAAGKARVRGLFLDALRTYCYTNMIVIPSFLAA